MQSSRQLITLVVSVLVLIALMVLMRNLVPEDENHNLAGAEFLVS
jgi:hypothetical protein